MTKLAVFDFDGTITIGDTFIQFIRFSRGGARFILGFMIMLPMILSWKLKIISNWQAKQHVFSYFFKGKSMEWFIEQGVLFRSMIKTNTKTIKALHDHLKSGDLVVIVSASIEQWITPWADSEGVNLVVSTKIGVDKDGRLTGKFSGENCHGAQKVVRLYQEIPELLACRNNYFVTAYGDSSGDKEMLAFADKALLVKKGQHIIIK